MPIRETSRFARKMPNILFQMLLRGSNAVGYANYPDNVVREFVIHSSEAGMDVSHFDSLNYLPNLKVAMETVVEKTPSLCEATSLLHWNFTNSNEEKYVLDYYVDLAKELEKMGRIFLLSRIWRVYASLAANKLVKTLRNEIGIPFISIPMIQVVYPHRLLRQLKPG